MLARSGEQSRWRSDHGEVSGRAIAGGAVLLLAYLAYPQPFYDFIHLFFNNVFNALHDNFSDHGATDTAKHVVHHARDHAAGR
jgi:hypothetical protein